MRYIESDKKIKILMLWTLMGKFFKITIFNIFTGQKMRRDRAKIGFAGQHDRPPFKNYFEP